MGRAFCLNSTTAHAADAPYPSGSCSGTCHSQPPLSRNRPVRPTVDDHRSRVSVSTSVSVAAVVMHVASAHRSVSPLAGAPGYGLAIHHFAFSPGLEGTPTGTNHQPGPGSCCSSSQRPACPFGRIGDGNRRQLGLRPVSCSMTAATWSSADQRAAPRSPGPIHTHRGSFWVPDNIQVWTSAAVRGSTPPNSHCARW